MSKEQQEAHELGNQLGMRSAGMQWGAPAVRAHERCNEEWG